MNVNNPHSIESFLTSGWRGYFSLWTAVWRYYLVGRVIALTVAGICVVYLGFFGWFIGLLIWFPYWMWSLVTVWKSAPNSPWTALGLIARIWVYLEAVLAIYNIDRLTLTSW